MCRHKFAVRRKADVTVAYMQLVCAFPLRASVSRFTAISGDTKNAAHGARYMVAHSATTKPMSANVFAMLQVCSAFFRIGQTELFRKSKPHFQRVRARDAHFVCTVQFRRQLRPSPVMVKKF